MRPRSRVVPALAFSAGGPRPDSRGSGRAGRTVLLLCVAAWGVACARTPASPGTGAEPVADPVVGPAGRTDGDSGPLVRASDLAGRRITEETRGAWAYRHAGGGGGADPGGDGSASGGGGGGGAESKRKLRGAVPGRVADAASGPARAPSSPGKSAAGGGGPPPGAKRGDDLESHDVAREHGKRDRSRAGLVSGGGADASTQPAHALHAGSTDDNADFPKFVAFLDEWTARPHLAGQFQRVDVRGRAFVRVVDAKGRPVPGARVTVLDESADRLVADGTTYGDGRAPVYPHAFTSGAAASVAAASGSATTVAAMPVRTANEFVVEVRRGAATARTRWSPATSDEVVVTLALDAPPPDPVPVDVAFLIDTTGSMGDEIASIQACLLRVTAQIRGLARESDLRYATVLYRDVGDEYLTATHPFTADVGALERALREVQAGGGGDGPESLNQGLAVTVGGLTWRENAAKVAFLIADAPPHMDYAGDTPYGESCRAAVAKGLRIHTVAASGIDEAGTLVFRQIAQYTRGKFVFLQYGVPATGEDAKRHGVGGAVKNDNLEDVLFEQIRDEVARYGR